MRNFGSRWIGLVFLCSNLLIFSTAALANDYYVSPTGSDSNNGLTPSTAWATIAHADSALSLGSGSGSTVACGDTNVGACVHVAAGTYNFTGSLTTNQSGTATARVVFYSDTKWGALIRTSCSGCNIWSSNGSYVSIVGFDLSGTTADYGIVPYGTNNNIYSNYIHDMAQDQVGAGCGAGGGAGVGGGSVTGASAHVIGNRINNVGIPGACNKVHGMYISNGTPVIENNVVSNASAWGLNCTHSCTSAVISNNTVFNNGGYGTSNNGTFAMGGCVLLGTASNVNTINNNICVNNGATGAGGDFLNINGSGLTNTLLSNNLIFDSQSGNQTACLAAGNGANCNPETVQFSLGSGTGNTTTGTLSSNPLFVNYQANGSGDYHLQSGSPAAAAGTTTCAPGGISPCVPSAAFDGNARPSPLSVGAYELVQTSLPSPPTGLAAVVQ